ncbi:hypothetical protein QYZ41_25300 [Vibrio parahaemolyticus]|nr:hypothetical protein [Vibrio parahaemolyticus]
MAGLLMDKGEYSEALNILFGLKPTMSVNNMLGVCFEHIGDWNSALEHSKLALEAMLSSGEKTILLLITISTACISLVTRLIKNNMKAMLSYSIKV